MENQTQHSQGIFSYFTDSRHPKFQVQADGWVNAHGKLLPYHMGLFGIQKP